MFTSPFFSSQPDISSTGVVDDEDEEEEEEEEEAGREGARDEEAEVA